MNAVPLKTAAKQQIILPFVNQTSNQHKCTVKFTVIERDISTANIVQHHHSPLTPLAQADKSLKAYDNCSIRFKTNKLFLMLNAKVSSEKVNHFSENDKLKQSQMINDAHQMCSSDLSIWHTVLHTGIPGASAPDQCAAATVGGWRRAKRIQVSTPGITLPTHPCRHPNPMHTPAHHHQPP